MRQRIFGFCRLRLAMTEWTESKPATMHAWCHYWQRHLEYYSYTTCAYASLPFNYILGVCVAIRTTTWNSRSRPAASPLLFLLLFLAAFRISTLLPILSLSLSLSVCVSLLGTTRIANTVSLCDYHGLLLTNTVCATLIDRPASLINRMSLT